MLVTARYTPNIALIKYWGNRNNGLRLPAADSLSMTLSEPTVDVSVEAAKYLSVRSTKSDGTEKRLSEAQIRRFQETIELMRRYLEALHIKEALPESLRISIHSHIPPGVGLASSAAVFSALARGVASLVEETQALAPEEISVLARLGSGSAARSIYGGFVTLESGEDNDIASAQAAQITDEHHWELHDIVVIPSEEAKKIGSTEGHALAQTSPHFIARIEAIRSHRQRDCIDAIQKKDFEKLQRVAEEDTTDMHHVMMTSKPPLRYLTEDTHRIVREVTSLREKEHLPVLYTMDAGPTVHLICPKDAADKIHAFAHSQKNCLIYATKIGKGATLLADGSA